MAGILHHGPNHLSGMTIEQAWVELRTIFAAFRAAGRLCSAGSRLAELFDGPAVDSAAEEAWRLAEPLSFEGGELAFAAVHLAPFCHPTLAAEAAALAGPAARRRHFA